MDLLDTINAHNEWQLKLSVHLEHGRGQFEPQALADDNQCMLGKWLSGDGIHHKNTAEYSALQNEHSKFHQCAAEIVRRCNSGDKSKAHNLLKTDFATHSRGVAKAISSMMSKLPYQK